MIKAFPKKTEEPNEPKRASSVGQVCDSLCEKMTKEAVWPWSKKKQPAAPPGPAGAGAVSPVGTAPAGSAAAGAPAAAPAGPVPGAQNQMAPGAQQKMKQQLDQKRMNAQQVQQLGKAMQFLIKNVTSVLGTKAPMIKNDKALVSFLSQYDELLDPKSVHNPQAMQNLQQQTAMFLKLMQDFTTRYNQTAARGNQFLAQTIGHIQNFSQVLANAMSSGPSGNAQMTPQAPAAAPGGMAVNPNDPSLVG